MTWKEFLMPDWRKVILFIITTIGVNYYIISTTVILDARILVGLPLGFWPVGSNFIRAGEQIPPSVDFSFTNLIIDVIFWYLLSCIIVWTYDKLKKKPEKKKKR
ncbi:MAG: hypothetical protein NTY73_02440 [Candidatus Micrarchaeota archaeon]|nr:hypothetical protein [Candidatus Micrarchaeota archaeon]